MIPTSAKLMKGNTFITSGSPYIGLSSEPNGLGANEQMIDMTYGIINSYSTAVYINSYNAYYDSPHSNATTSIWYYSSNGSGTLIHHGAQSSYDTMYMPHIRLDSISGGLQRFIVQTSTGNTPGDFQVSSYISPTYQWNNLTFTSLTTSPNYTKFVFYLNGVQFFQSTLISTFTDLSYIARYSIGATHEGAGGQNLWIYYNNNITVNDYRFYDTILSPTQIQQLASPSNHMKVSSSTAGNLLWWYPFNDGPADTLTPTSSVYPSSESTMNITAKQGNIYYGLPGGTSSATTRMYYRERI